MPGTRTAGVPGVDIPTAKRVSLNFVDATTDSKSNSILVPASATYAQIETFAAETQERSNASLWEIEVTEVWQGAKQSGNALSDPRLAVQDNIRYTVKAQPNTYQQLYIPAPLLTQFVTGSETPDVTALTDWFTAALALVAAGYAGLNVEFVEHKERNQKIKF